MAIELSKKIEGTRQLGSEFLTWLLYRSLSGEGQVPSDRGTVELWFEDRITFASPFAGGELDILKGEDPATTGEARSALLQGKHVEAASLSLTFEGKRWTFQVSGPRLALAAVKVPAVATETDLESVMERFALLGGLEEIMWSLYHRFLQVRLDAGAWKKECSQIEKWVKKLGKD
jgi:hypothetical protein